MKRVTGLGGVFFKAKGDPKNLNAWYEKHLGLNYKDAGGYPFWMWRSMNDPAKVGATVWSIFKSDTDYFNPSGAPFMFNFRVENLEELLNVLKEEGVQIAGEVQEFEYGKFGWILDPEGNKIELWEPAPGYMFPGGMDSE